MRRSVIISFLLLISISCSRHAVQAPVGMWNATVSTPNGGQVSFVLQVEEKGGAISGALINGDDRNESSSGSFADETLRLRFDYYDADLIAKFANEKLTGTFNRQWRRETLTREFSAQRQASSVSNDQAQSLSLQGEWVMSIDGAANKSVLSIARASGELRATVLEVSGDWGTFTGRLEDGGFVFSRFDGINARVIRGQSRFDTLTGMIDRGLKSKPVNFTAERVNEANRRSLPDPATQARIRNKSAPFEFSFADLDGKLVSSTDGRFADKVVIITITGSWCPNCHDEAPVLEDLYQRHRDAGLEVVALAFEYTGDAHRDAEQLRSFVRRHSLTFPVLLAGSTDEGEVARKLPQIESFGGYPTTLFLGRDGRVRRIHTGFDGKATGERFVRLKADMEEWVTSLLSE
jgi:thiol-disulfide isomerase/thioredoxin